MVDHSKLVNLCIICSAALSYILTMVIIPKSVTIPIVVVIALLIGMSWYLKFYRQPLINVLPFVKAFGPFYLWVVLSVFWTVNSDYSFALIRALLGLEFACLIGMLATKESSLKYALIGFVVGGLLSSAVVLYNQYMFIGMMRLGNKIYGSAMEFSGGLTFSAYSCLVLYRQEKKIAHAILFLGFIALCALSGSRTAVLFPIVFFVLLDFFYNQNIYKTIKIAISAIFIIGTLFFTCMNVPVFYKVVGYRLETILEDKTEDGSYMERNEMKEYGIKLWKEKPFIGWGIHGFARKFQSVHRYVYSHCDYAELLSCFGIIGFSLFYFPYLSILSKRNLYIKARQNYWYSFFIAFLFLNIIQSGASIHFLNMRTMMVLSVICNRALVVQNA